MLVEWRWFDVSSSHLEGYRRLQTIAGNGSWIPTFEPRAFPERGAIHLLLRVLHRHRLCCFLTGTFTIFTAGILHSYASATVFIVLTNAPILDLIFRRGPHSSQEFIIQGFKFVFGGAENDLDIYFYRVIGVQNLVCWSLFFGIDSSIPCGPPSNLNFMHFIWEQSKSLLFVKYAILLFPSNSLVA
jgi:hypothetical protein